MAAQLDLTEKENGKDLWMDRGDLLVFRLPSNPSTGYSWNVDASKPGLLLQQGEASCEIPKSAKGRIGVGGTEVWRFRAERAGMLTLTFSYARVWEKGVPPVRTLSWPVTIRPIAK
jgi:inhibitor of cysteine peptidase